jgi:D-3-phosphoglycerate dehydrogenase
MIERKIVVSDLMDNVGLDILRKGVEKVIYLPELPERTIADEIRDTHAIIVRGKTKVNRKLLELGKNLIVIAKHGVGFDNIDVEAATQKGIFVVNTPFANTESVAEHDLGLMLSLAKNICRADRELRQNNFSKREDYVGVELKDKKLGVIGLGKIGSELAHKCKIAFDMDIIFYDPYVLGDNLKELSYKKAEKLENLLMEADYVVICVPLTKDTTNLIGPAELGLMKRSAFLINSSRGDIVDESALYDHLFQRKIAGAALDVFSQEPPVLENPLFKLDNFIGTPHLGGVTVEALKRMAITVAEEILCVLGGQKPKYLVNPQVLR